MTIREIGELTDWVTTVLEYLDDHLDIEDGDDGRPRPNRAMSLYTEGERVYKPLLDAWLQQSRTAQR